MAEGKSLYGSKPEEVFKGRYARRYRSELGVITGEIVTLNVNLFIAHRIVEFRSDLFRLNLNHFWDYTLESLLDSAIATIFKMAYDERKDRLTLRAFKKEIENNLADKKHKAELTSRTDGADLDAKFGQYKDVLQIQRHRRIAHFKREYNVKPEQADWRDRREIFQVLPDIVKTVNAFFDALCIHGGVAKMPFEYYENSTPPPGSDERPDIDVLLDWVAKESTLLNFPETDPDFWRDYRLGLKPEDIEEINRYRRKFGKNEV